MTIIKAVGLAIVAITAAIVLISDPADFWGLVGLFALSKISFIGLLLFSVLLTIFGSKALSKFSNLNLLKVTISNRATGFIVLVSAALLFWFARSNNLILGDGLWLIEHVHSGHITMSAESLTILLHIVVSKLLKIFLDSPSLGSFRLISIGAGLIYVFSVLLLSKQLFKDKSLVVFSVISFWTLGIVQLYFGYVEVYALPYSLAPLLFYFAYRFIIGEKSIILVLAIFLLMCAMHLVSLSLSPAVLYLIYVKSKTNSLYRFRHVVSTATFIMGAIFIFYFFNKLEGHVFVGLTESLRFPYSFFSSEHIMDMFNLLLLNSMFSIFLAIIVFFSRKELSIASQPSMVFQRFAALGAMSGLFFSSIIDPKLGAFRDWDLLAFFVVPLHVFVLSVLRRNDRLNNFSKELIISALVFTVLFTSPWILYNKLSLKESIGTSFMILNNDIHYSTQYDAGERMKSLAVILTDPKVGAYSEAEILLNRHISKNPSDNRTFHMLIYSMMNRKEFTKAFELSQGLLTKNANNAKNILQTASLAVQSGHPQEALDYLSTLQPSDTLLPIVQGVRAQANYGLGKLADAEQEFGRAITGNVKDREVLRTYAEYLFKKGLTDSTQIVLKKIDSLEAVELKFD